MSITLRIALVIITIMYLILIVSAVKKRKMQTSIAIFWTLTGVLLIIAIAIPNLIELISNFLGFEKASNMIFCLAIFIAFCLNLMLTMIIAKIESRCTTLVQEISILNKKIIAMEDKINGKRENEEENT